MIDMIHWQLQCDEFLHNSSGICDSVANLISFLCGNIAFYSQTVCS